MDFANLLFFENTKYMLIRLLQQLYKSFARKMFINVVKYLKYAFASNIIRFDYIKMRPQILK